MFLHCLDFFLQILAVQCLGFKWFQNNEVSAETKF